jgi:hypothetical protein
MVMRKAKLMRNVNEPSAKITELHEKSDTGSIFYWSEKWKGAVSASNKHSPNGGLGRPEGEASDAK